MGTEPGRPGGGGGIPPGPAHGGGGSMRRGGPPGVVEVGGAGGSGGRCGAPLTENAMLGIDFVKYFHFIQWLITFGFVIMTSINIVIKSINFPLQINGNSVAN